MSGKPLSVASVREGRRTAEQRRVKELERAVRPDAVPACPVDRVNRGSGLNRRYRELGQSARHRSRNLGDLRSNMNVWFRAAKRAVPRSAQGRLRVQPIAPLPTAVNLWPTHAPKRDTSNCSAAPLQVPVIEGRLLHGSLAAKAPAPLNAHASPRASVDSPQPTRLVGRVYLNPSSPAPIASTRSLVGRSPPCSSYCPSILRGGRP